MPLIGYSEFQSIADQVEGDIRMDYSGRGMYGKVCPAITTEYTPNLVLVGALIVEALSDNVLDKESFFDSIELAKEIAMDARIDSMGLGSVVYFPGLNVE